jgi:hypothetical protein
LDIFFIDLFSKLQTWYNQIPELYSPSFCLLNEHMVGVHLWQCCENYGPLASHNCFAFESFYGHLVKLKNPNASYSTKMLFSLGHYQILQYIGNKTGIGNDTWQGKIMEKIGISVKQVQNK